MPPKLDPSQVVDVYVQVSGGEARAVIGPLGHSLKKIEEDIAKKPPRTGKASA